MTATPTSAEPGVRRHLDVVDAGALFVGVILGSGIFVAPSAVAAAAPSLAAASALWIGGGIVACCGAFCYAECASRLPKTGGFFVFYRAAYGDALAFVGGWAALLVTYPASLAAISLVFARYLREVTPAVVQAVPDSLTGACAIGVCALLSVVGLRTGPLAQRLLTGAKVASLGLLALAAVLGGGFPDAPPAPAPPGAWTVQALLLAAVVLLFTYDGWSDITLVAGEIRDPARNLWKAVGLGIAILTALYVLVQGAVLSLLPADRAAASTQVLAEAVEAGLGPEVARPMALLVVVTTFGAMQALVFTTSRLAFAMAREGVFLRYFGELSPRWGTPARSVLVVAVAGLAYLTTSAFETLLGLFSFSVWIFYALTAAAVLILRGRGVGDPGAWRAPGGPAAPAVILATAAFMTGGLLLQSPGRSLGGLILLAAGFPVFAIWRHWRGRP